MNIKMFAIEALMLFILSVVAGQASKFVTNNEQHGVQTPNGFYGWHANGGNAVPNNNNQSLASIESQIVPHGYPLNGGGKETKKEANEVIIIKTNVQGTGWNDNTKPNMGFGSKPSNVKPSQHNPVIRIQQQELGRLNNTQPGRKPSNPTGVQGVKIIKSHAYQTGRLNNTYPKMKT